MGMWYADIDLMRVMREGAPGATGLQSIESADEVGVRGKEVAFVEIDADDILLVATNLGLMVAPRTDISSSLVAEEESSV